MLTHARSTRLGGPESVCSPNLPGVAGEVIQRTELGVKLAGIVLGNPFHCRARGLTLDPKLATGDGALGSLVAYQLAYWITVHRQ